MQHALVAHALWEEEKRRARAATKAKLRTHPGGLDDLEEVTDEDESRSSSPGSPRSSLVAGAGEAGEAELHIYDPTNSRTPPHLPGDHSPNRLPPSPTRPPPPPSSPSRRGRIQETELERREKDSISPPPRLPPRTHEEEEGVGFVAGHETCIGRYSQPCRSGGESCYDTKWFRAVVVLALLGVVAMEVLVAKPHRQKIRDQLRPSAPVHYPLAGKWVDDQWRPMLCDEYSEVPVKYFTNHDVYDHTGGEAMLFACSGHKYFTFIGDSRMRNLYFAFVQAVNSKVHTAFDIDAQAEMTHVDLNMTLLNLGIYAEFIWAPNIDDGRLEEMNDKWEEREQWPDLVLVSAGLWALKAGIKVDAMGGALKVLHKQLSRLSGETTSMWMPVGHVNEKELHPSRDKITNDGIDCFNTAVHIELSSPRWSWPFNVGFNNKRKRTTTSSTRTKTTTTKTTRTRLVPMAGSDGGGGSSADGHGEDANTGHAEPAFNDDGFRDESCLVGAGAIRTFSAAVEIYAASEDRTIDGLHFKSEVHQAILSDLFNMFCDNGHCCTVSQSIVEIEE